MSRAAQARICRQSGSVIKGALLHLASLARRKPDRRDALGQCHERLSAAELDPCHGFLHSPKPGRLSLAYDTIELHRTALTESVFAYAAKGEFRLGDFEMDKQGMVRLGGPLARDIAVLALKVAPLANCSRR
jgi:CRISPR/Cas system-associated endonuclease Cas1